MATAVTSGSHGGPESLSGSHSPHLPQWKALAPTPWLQQLPLHSERGAHKGTAPICLQALCLGTHTWAGWPSGPVQ